MTAFVLLGVVTAAAGVLFLIKPSALIRLSEVMNRIVTTDNKAIQYRISVGLILLVLGAFFLFMAYYLNRVGIPL